MALAPALARASVETAAPEITNLFSICGWNCSQSSETYDSLHNKEYFLNLEKMSVNGIPSYTYIKRILYVQVSTRNSYKFLRILDVYYTYFFDVNDRKNDPKVVRKLNVHYTCNLERIQFHLFKRY